MPKENSFQPYGRPLDALLKTKDPRTEEIRFDHPEAEIKGWISQAKKQFPGLDGSDLANAVASELENSLQEYTRIESDNPTAIQKAVDQERDEVWSKGQGRSEDESVQKVFGLRSRILRLRTMEKALSQEKLAA